jgi:hypothetical protein
MGTATLTDIETGKTITIETTLEKAMTIMTTGTATTTISEPEQPCGRKPHSSRSRLRSVSRWGPKGSSKSSALVGAAIFGLALAGTAIGAMAIGALGIGALGINNLGWGRPDRGVEYREAYCG